jgi:hypothetical protein
MPSARDSVTNTVSHIRNLFGVFGSANEYWPPTAPTPGEGSQAAHARMDSSMSPNIFRSAPHHPAESNPPPPGPSTWIFFRFLCVLIPCHASPAIGPRHEQPADVLVPNLTQLYIRAAEPLTHALVRSDFRFTKAGPTPEQLKLISSPGSFVRFGVPFGPDVIAYASRSRRLGTYA